jgi:mannose/fructose/N-acetylgalactosamine-specific phosphotransferase system component IIB
MSLSFSHRSLKSLNVGKHLYHKGNGEIDKSLLNEKELSKFEKLRNDFLVSPVI